MNLLDLLKHNIHEWKVRNTNDPQLQAFTEFYDPRITGPQVSPTVDVYTEMLQRKKAMEGSPYTGFSGMPTFESGQGTRNDPLLGSMDAVGVVGFRGGSKPADESAVYSRSDYLDGPFAGVRTESLLSGDNGRSGGKYLTHTDAGTYDFDDQKWYDWRYRTN